MYTLELNDTLESIGTIACVNGKSAKVKFRFTLIGALVQGLIACLVDRLKVTWRHENTLKTIKKDDGKTATVPIKTVDEIYALCEKVGDEYILNVNVADMFRKVRTPKVAEPTLNMSDIQSMLDEMDPESAQILRDRCKARGIAI